jgi:hypothetical protein
MIFTNVISVMKEDEIGGEVTRIRIFWARARKSALSTDMLAGSKF